MVKRTNRRPGGFPTVTVDVIVTGLVILAGAAAVLLALWLALLAPARSVRRFPRARTFSAHEPDRSDLESLFRNAFAHRGLHRRDGSVPENSLSAFAAARDAGYGIELDLNITRDGRVVVFHDKDLDRACGVPGRIEEKTWEELQTLRLFDSDQGIPLLEDVLREIDGSVPLIVELKDTARHRELSEAAATLLDRYNGPYCIESFHPAIVRWFRRHRPSVIRGQLSAGPREFSDQSPPVRLLLSSLFTNGATRPHFVACRHQDAATSRPGAPGPRLRWRLRLFRRLGGSLVAWTVDDEVTRQWCEELFDTIIFEFIEP